MSVLADHWDIVVLQEKTPPVLQIIVHLCKCNCWTSIYWNGLDFGFSLLKNKEKKKKKLLTVLTRTNLKHLISFDKLISSKV